MIKITFDFPTIEEAITALAKIRADSSPDKATAAPKADKPAKTEKAAPTPPTATKADAPATPPPASPPPAADTAAKYEIVKSTISKLTADPQNIPTVKGVLARFGATNGKTLKPEDYDAFLTAVGAPAEEDLS